MYKSPQVTKIVWNSLPNRIINTINLVVQVPIKKD